MGKIKQFIENNAKIIEVVFSTISLLIVGVVGTTISINNSITSKTSLELSKAQAQPVFTLDISYPADSEGTEYLTISIDDGFAENVSVEEYTYIKAESDDGAIKINYYVENYFYNYGYTGNNKGQISRLYNQDNFKSYLSFLKNCMTSDISTNVSKNIIVVIKYKDILGKNNTRYYQTVSNYFNHLDASEGEEIIKEINSYPKIKIDELAQKTI